MADDFAGGEAREGICGAQLERCLDESVRMVIEGAQSAASIAPAGAGRTGRPHRSTYNPASDRAVKRVQKRERAPAGLAATRTVVGLAAISGGMAR